MQGKELLPVDTWKSLMEQAIHNGLMFASITGGECLTYPGFKELYLFLKSQGVEITVLTNGVLIDDAWVDFFRTNPPAVIQITLYGVDDDEYECVTGQRAFHKVTAALDKLQKAEIPLSISITPNPYMMNGMELVRFVHARNIPYMINAGLKTPRFETGRDKTEAPIDSYVSMIRERMILENGKTQELFESEDLPDVRGNETVTTEGIQCAAGKSSFIINWEGVMMPCNTFTSITAKPLETGFDAAWAHINHLANHYPMPVECIGCKYRHICKNCILEHAEAAPAGHVNPLVCEFTRSMVKAGIIEL